YDLPEAARRNLAYYFAYDYKTPQDVARYADPLVRRVHAWRTTWRHAELVSVDLNDRLVVFDTRPRAAAPVTVLSGADREVYASCAAIADASQFGQSPAGRLEAIASRGLMLRDGSKFLSLAIPIGEYRPSHASLSKLRPLFTRVDDRDRRLVRSAFSTTVVAACRRTRGKVRLKPDATCDTRRRDGEEEEGRYQEEGRQEAQRGREKEEGRVYFLRPFNRRADSHP